jgi:hypothetical protein
MTALHRGQPLLNVSAALKSMSTRGRPGKHIGAASPKILRWKERAGCKKKDNQAASNR